MPLSDNEIIATIAPVSADLLDIVNALVTESDRHMLSAAYKDMRTAGELREMFVGDALKRLDKLIVALRMLGKNWRKERVRVLKYVSENGEVSFQNVDGGKFVAAPPKTAFIYDARTGELLSDVKKEPAGIHWGVYLPEGTSGLLIKESEQ
ncbi:MAG: hypothetical protein IKK39_15600 [Thermoguttaceae bacterium]|nr:hypothetical protein [Thermoguttaceae bacterium]MBR4105468.1 hypothetical protein [Thermoguttaceae bacterium]